MRLVCGGLLVAFSAFGLARVMPAAAPKGMPGAAVFQASGCAQCHGETGRGTEKGPSLAGVGRKLGREKIERQIREGGGAMPGFGEVLTPDEIGQLGEWLGTWKTVAKR